MTAVRVFALSYERARFFYRATLGLLLFTGVTALLSAIAAFAGILEMDRADLSATPFTNWHAPMLILAVVVGGGNLAAAYATFLRRAVAPALAVAAGALLTGFVLCEVWWLGIESFLQPFYLTVGAGTMFAAWSWARLSRTT